MMMTMRACAVLALAFLTLAQPITAELGSIDPKPAATLLLPYFEVDLANVPNGVTTLFSVGNATAEPALAQVTLWTDWGVPTLSFPIYLTGFDVETINLARVFRGIPGSTADAGNDPGDTISPVGPLSLDGSFPGCGSFFPTAPLSPALQQKIVQAHTGQVVTLAATCLGWDWGDGIARGYVTIDSIQECSALNPTDDVLDYFLDGGLGVANNRNQLWGDWFIVDPVNDFAQGDTLVHIEAYDGLTALNIPLLTPTEPIEPITPVDPNDPNAPFLVVANVVNPTGYTFYGRYQAPPTGADNREPLGTVWASRFLNGGAFSGGTNLLVWRDSTSSQVDPGIDDWCGVGPSWFPLNEMEVVAFNTAEDAIEICQPAGPDPVCFPFVTGRYYAGFGDLAVPYPFGWYMLNLNNRPDAPVGDADFGSGGNIAQSHVSAMHSALGRFSVGMQAVPVRDAFHDDEGKIGPVPPP